MTRHSDDDYFEQVIEDRREEAIDRAYHDAARFRNVPDDLTAQQHNTPDHWAFDR